ILAPQPVIAGSGGVTFDGNPTAGSLIHIHGWNLAMQETLGTTLGTALSGTSLAINNTPIPLIYVSPTQIVGQLPFDLAKISNYTINNPNGFVTRSIAL